MALRRGQVSVFAPSTSRRLNTLVLVFTGMMTLAVLISQTANAQPASCDPNYWNSLKGKAWMEAQREIAQNQNLIYKPDSVLEYTCFDRFLDVLSNTAPQLFSETTTWGSIVGPDMSNALQRLVNMGVQSYIGSNYNHNLLGGRSNLNEYTPSAVTKQAYTCDIMAKAWEAAKCLNFIQANPDRTAYDDFFFLSKYNGWDPRNLPSSMGACAADARWAANTGLALNDGSGPTTYTEETFNTYANQFATSGCPAGAIPTGISVTRFPRFDTYDEFVCINPGCAYTPGSGCSQTAGDPPVSSDRSLKENIVFVGIENGHNVYEFNYKGQSQKYIGVMADEILKTNPDAVVDMGGYMGVYYDRIGVEFRKAP